MDQAFLYKVIGSNTYTFYDYTGGDNHAKAQLKLPGASGTNPSSDCDCHGEIRWEQGQGLLQ
jgi:hypothetical protein